MGAGMLFALGGNTGIMGHREPDGSLHLYLGHRSDENWIDTIDVADTRTARAKILKLRDGWSESLRGLIANADTPSRRAASTPFRSRTPGIASPASP